MDEHKFVQVTRTLVKRSFTDIERKITAAMISGGVGYGALSVLAAYGVKIPTNVAELVPYATALLGGWWAHSLGAVTTVSTSPAGTTQVSTSTGSIRIPAAYLPQPHPVPVAPAPAPNPGVVPDPEPLEVPDQDGQPAVNTGSTSVTQILNPNDRFAAVLSSLPSAQDDH